MDWFTIEEAADSLSSSLGRQITNRHIFNFALRNELVLSCKLLGEQACREVSYIPFEDANVTLSRIPKDLIPPKLLSQCVVAETAMPAVLATAIKKSLTGKELASGEWEALLPLMRDILLHLPALEDVYTLDEIRNFPREYKALIREPTESIEALFGFDGFRVYENEKHVLKYINREAIKFITGLWDISLLGNFRSLLERYRQNLISHGGAYTLIDPTAGYILKNTETGSLVQLVKHEVIKGTYKDTYEISVLNDLSLDNVEIVVRCEEVRRYIEAVQPAGTPNPSKPTKNDTDKASEHDNNPSLKSSSRVTTSTNNTQSLADEKREEDEIRNPWKAQIRNIIEALIEKNREVPSVKIVISEIEKQVEEDPDHFKKQEAKVTSTQAETAMNRGHTDRVTEYVIHGEAKTIRTWKDNIKLELQRFSNNQSSFLTESTESTESTEKRLINL